MHPFSDSDLIHFDQVFLFLIELLLNLIKDLKASLAFSIQFVIKRHSFFHSFLLESLCCGELSWIHFLSMKIFGHVLDSLEILSFSMIISLLKLYETLHWTEYLSICDQGS